MLNNFGLQGIPSAAGSIPVVIYEQELHANGAIRFAVPDFGDVLQISFLGRTMDAAGSSTLSLFFNNDRAATNYYYSLHYGGSGGINKEANNTSLIYCNGQAAATFYATSIFMTIVDFRSRDHYKTAIGTSHLSYPATGNYAMKNSIHWWKQDRIHTVTLYPPTTGIFEKGTSIMAWII